MSMFIEVNSKEKKCPVIVNLDRVFEIAPLASGGCRLFYDVQDVHLGKSELVSLEVTDDYSMFKQLAMQMVTAEDIAARFPKPTQPAVTETKAPKTPKEKASKPAELDVPKFGV